MGHRIPCYCLLGGCLFYCKHPVKAPIGLH